MSVNFSGFGKVWFGLNFLRIERSDRYLYTYNCRLYLFWVYRACLDLQILLDFSHRVGSGREAWARHITNWRTVTTPLGLVASYCSSYHHISICLLDAFCIMDPYFGHQLLYVHMTAMYILLKGAPFEVQCES